MIYLNLAAPGFRKRKRKQAILNRLIPVYDKVNQSGKGLGSTLFKAGKLILAQKQSNLNLERK